MADLEFFFDPVCPFCWVTSQWVRNVRRERGLEVRWRPISLAILNEAPGAYDDKPTGYPQAHRRGHELLRVAAAARAAHGDAVLDPLYLAMGSAIWRSEPPAEASFEAILEHTATAGDVRAMLRDADLPEDLATAADDPAWDPVLRTETTEALERVGGDVGTPILSFSPPDGPAFFGPVISEAPDGEEAVRLWDAITTLSRWDGFAELKRRLRRFPATPTTAKLAGEATRAA